MYSGARPPGIRDDEADVVGRVDLRERDVDRQLASVLLGVGVRAGVEVVDHELDVAARKRGHVGDVARLPKPVDRIHRVELLGGVADEHEHLLLRHGTSLLLGQSNAKYFGSRNSSRPW
jgi:hypothetical protein